MEIQKLVDTANNEEDHELRKDLQTTKKVKRDLLRFEGDHIHNNAVIEKKEGEIILAKRIDNPFKKTKEKQPIL